MTYALSFHPRLVAELDRLFPGQWDASTGLAPCDAAGQVRTLVVGIARGRDWSALADLLVGCQLLLDRPLPALMVDGRAGFRYFLPLAEAVSPTTARAVLEGLRQRYLAEVPVADVLLAPGPEAPERIPLLPVRAEDSERWSAFIDPGMGAVFAEDGGLDFEPNPERQADLLARVMPLSAAEFVRLQADVTAPAGEASAGGPADGVAGVTGVLAGPYDDPREFLKAVMNDATVPLALRIDAAKALLPTRSDG